MSATSGLANSALLAASSPSAAAFRRALRDPERAQASVLRRILASNTATAFGREHEFAGIRGPRDFAAAVAVADWDGLSPWMARVVEGEAAVMTSEPVELFEPTGGSAGGTKLIPVTGSSRRDVRRAIAPWVRDLYAHNPAALRGCAYWSVSPVGERARSTEAGVPIGFDSDEEYLGGPLARLFRASMAAPSALSTITGMATFRYATLLHLLRRRDLTLVSVWNPTFFTLLLRDLLEFSEALVEDIAAGGMRPPGGPGIGLPSAVLHGLRPDPLRAREVASALAAGDPAERHARLWPELTVVSCWADAHAAMPAATLAGLLPQATLQPKGLLATEACFTVPVTDAPGPVPALRSHYFEFEPIGGGNAVGIAGVEQGRRYSVVVTTSAGLYRYRIGDVVEGGEPWHGCPTLRFVGRAEVSDHFGEKLDDAHVAGAIARAFGEMAHTLDFAMLAYDAGAGGYSLFFEVPASAGLDSDALADRLEQTLCDNVHYAYCRRLGQLAPVRVVPVRDGSATYLAECVARGQRAGDVKVAALHVGDRWPEVFARAARR